LLKEDRQAQQPEKSLHDAKHKKKYSDGNDAVHVPVKQLLSTFLNDSHQVLPIILPSHFTNVLKLRRKRRRRGISDNSWILVIQQQQQMILPTNMERNFHMEMSSSLSLLEKVEFHSFPSIILK
jgi:hypothetical protein